MTQKLQKRYGLPTAIAMVVGIVIGSGVFFKAEKILNATGGNLPLGIAAWLIGGLIMISCICAFAVLAAKYEKVSGVVDYAEAAVGSGYAYYMGWFMAIVYYPTMTSVLAWVSARYFAILIGWDITGAPCMSLAGFFLVSAYVLNALSPVLAGKFQVATTVIKLIPLALMAFVGTFVGLKSGMTVQNFTYQAVQTGNSGSLLFTAVVATSFAYEGWIIATSINAELKDAKRNLPKALLAGAVIIMLVYILYFIGLSGAVSNETMMAGGEQGAKLAFQTIFGKVGAAIVFVVILISCLGTLNGLMLGNVRGLYALAVRKQGPRPDIYGQIDKTTNMPTNSAILGLFLAAFWLLYFYGANLVPHSWFGPFTFDTSELPIIAIYALYIPIFLRMMIGERGLSPFKRFFLPALALCGCGFMILATMVSYKTTALYFLLLVALLFLLGARFRKG